MSELAGKRALVTGGSRGIGAGIARAFASKGADVVITYERLTDHANGVVRAIEEMGRHGFAIQADSADPAAVQHSVSEAVRVLGGLDILVNNAGIARYGAIEAMDPADIDALLNVNVRSVVVASRMAIPHLKQGGRIISIGSSVAERVPLPGMTMYSVTKSALLAFTRGLSRDLGPRDITVNLVQPGPIDTDMTPADGEQAESIRGMTSLGRYGTTDEIAAAVAFLASPEAGQITGSVLTVDGGANA